MNTYVMIETHHDSSPSFSKCQASNIKEAIIKGFKFYPWVFQDIKQGLEEQGKLKREDNSKEAEDLVMKETEKGILSYYGVEGEDKNEYPEEISDHEYIMIVEVTPEGKVTAYPGEEITQCNHDPED